MKRKSSKGRKSSARKRGGRTPLEAIADEAFDSLLRHFIEPKNDGPEIATEPPPTLKKLNHHDQL